MSGHSRLPQSDSADNGLQHTTSGLKPDASEPMDSSQTRLPETNEHVDGVSQGNTDEHNSGHHRAVSGFQASHQRSHSRSNSQSQPSPMSIMELCNTSDVEHSSAPITSSDATTPCIPVTPAAATHLSLGANGHEGDDLSKRDLDVQLAAQVLGDMRGMDLRRSLSNYRGSTASSNSSACSTPSSASLTTSPASTSPTRLGTVPAFPPPSTTSNHLISHQQPHPHHDPSDHFITRVSSIPIVNSALKAYEQSKAHSKVVKYAAEGVESSVQKVWKPVVNKLEPRLGQLDEFACRQLDKLEQKFPAIMESPTNIYESSKRTVGDAVYRFLPNSSGVGANDLHGRHFQGPQQQRLQQQQEQLGGMIGADSQHWQPNQHQEEYEIAAELRRREVRQRSDYSDGSTHGTYSDSDSSSRPGTPSRLSQSSSSPFHGKAVSAGEQRQTRSRWQQVLVEAGAAAGAAGAAMSEESMRSLKYSLQWLQYASSHIDHQISLLKSYLAHLAATASSSAAANSTAVAMTASASSTLAAIKREVVETLRKVVEVVGRYAGAALPGEARRAVRSFILTLPSRWATLNAPSVEASPVLGPLMGAGPSVLSPAEAAHRVLTLATESLVMLKSVAGILGETVQRAEGWVERLRVMGVNAGGGAPGASALPIGGIFPPSSAFGSRSATPELLTSNQKGVMPVASRRRPFKETWTPKSSAFKSSSTGSPLNALNGLGLANTSNGSPAATMNEHRESFREYTDDESDLDTVLDGMKQSIVRSSSICSTVSSCSEYSSTSTTSIPAFSSHSSLRSETDSGVSIISSTSAGLLLGADEDMGVKGCETEMKDDHSKNFGGIALPSIQYLHQPQIPSHYPISLPQPVQPLHPQYQNPLDRHQFHQNGNGNGNGNGIRRHQHHRIPSLPTFDSGFGAGASIGKPLSRASTPIKDVKSDGIVRMDLE